MSARARVLCGIANPPSPAAAVAKKARRERLAMVSTLGCSDICTLRGQGCRIRIADGAVCVKRRSEGLPPGRRKGNHLGAVCTRLVGQRSVIGSSKLTVTVVFKQPFDLLVNTNNALELRQEVNRAYAGGF